MVPILLVKVMQSMVEVESCLFGSPASFAFFGDHAGSLLIWVALPPSSVSIVFYKAKPLSLHLDIFPLSLDQWVRHVSQNPLQPL